MRLIFFQNMVSPHQMPYIEQLPKMEGVDEVIVIVPEVGLDERSLLGWDVSKWLKTEGVKIIVAPAEKEVERLINGDDNGNQDEDTWFLFSGINAFPEVAKWFRTSLNYKVKRAVITEPPFVFDHPLWQHAIRFAMQDWRYVKYIDKIFVMGEDYLSYYRFWSRRWEVIPFMYCTDVPNDKRCFNENKDEGYRVKVLYVGSLSPRKNVGCLLRAVGLLDDEEQKRLKIGIVGNGEEYAMLAQQARKLKSEVKLYGALTMDSVPIIMQRYDVLVLPSLHDGWGAVVNEALMLGLYVICSDHCGAKMLVKESCNGVTFKNNDHNDLAVKISNCIDKCEEIRMNTGKRITWSCKNISGEAVANYFLEKLKG